jgi:hypothetical protein
MWQRIRGGLGNPIVPRGFERRARSFAVVDDAAEQLTSDRNAIGFTHRPGTGYRFK